MTSRRFGLLAVWVFLLLANSACVGVGQSRVIDIAPSQSPRLMIARESRGVDIQWESVKNQRYSLLYRDGQNKKAPWQPIPGATNVRGTGGVMSVRDPSPGAYHRSYMLETQADESPFSGRR